MNKRKRIYQEILTAALLFMGSVVIGWCFGLTIMWGHWWIVPAIIIVLAPPTAYLTYLWEKRQRYLEGSRVVLKRYRGHE